MRFWSNNNKYFHSPPLDSNIFMEIVKNNKVNVLPMEFAETEDYFHRELDEWRNIVEHYESLVESIAILQESDPKVILLVI